MIYISIALYSIMMLVFAIANKRKAKKTEMLDSAKVAVVIPFRNEEKNMLALLQSLESQTYPKDLVTIYFVDDHSEDNSRTFIPENTNYILLQSNGIGKKEALDTGINASKESIILTTDADSILHPQWIEKMVSTLTEMKLDLLIGGVAIKDHNLMSRFMKIELGNLVASAIGSAKIKRAFLSNGANLAFQKSLYMNAKALRNDEQLASGDDVFLLFAAKKMNAAVGSVNAISSTVFTAMNTDLKSFIHQRVRWIKKASAYRDSDAILISTVILLNNLSSLALWFLPIDLQQIMIVFSIKWVAEYLNYLSLRQNRFNFLDGICSFLLSLLYPFYTIIVALTAIFLRPQWKGRSI